MPAIPEPSHATVREIYRLHEVRADTAPRAHLGASVIGHECRRYLWLSFRWAAQESFDGRMRRLFETGLREEARLLDELRAIGMTVADRDENGGQFTFNECAGHFGASLDGAVLGLPEAHKAWHVFESKTMNSKSFADLKAKGIEKSKPMHWAQVQCYMGLSGMERAAYFAVCKDTDEIYMERIHFDRKAYDALLAKAAAIINSATPPERISDDAAWWQCRFCRFREQCHGTAAPLVNCRTCAHATPTEGGAWRCELADINRDYEFQRLGCESHVYIPQMIERFAELMSADDDVVVWRNKLTGREFRQPEYLSREILAAEDKRMLGEEGVDHFKGVFGSVRIVNTGQMRRDPPAPDPTFKDDIPWERTNEPNRVDGREGCAAKPAGNARRGARRVPVV